MRIAEAAIFAELLGAVEAQLGRAATREDQAE